MVEGVSRRAPSARARDPYGTGLGGRVRASTAAPAPSRCAAPRPAASPTLFGRPRHETATLRAPDECGPPGRHPGRRRSDRRTPLLHAQLPRLAILIREHPDRTLVELPQALPTSASLQTIWRAVTKLGFRLKKTGHATDHARPDVAEARAAWQQTAPTWDPARLVFLDERGVRTDLVRRYGRGHRGERVVDHAPDSRWHTTTFLGGCAKLS